MFGPKVIATLAVTVLTAAGCAPPNPPAVAEPCQPATNGTNVTKPELSGPAGTERDIATNPEIATGYRSDMSAVRTATFAVATANPLATRAACQVLADGGSAADAIVTAQAVLGLVEPQSSGIGGGGFLLYYDAASGSVQAYDGRETAPGAATENYLRWIDDSHRSTPLPDTRSSGRSIGIPGILRMLHDAQHDHGNKNWRDLFGAAIDLADNGFAISPRLAASIADAAGSLAVDQRARSYFLRPDGSAKPAGTRLNNPAYAKTLGAVATDGPDAFYTGAIAHDIVAAATDTTGGRTPSLLTAADLAAYETKRHDPLCIGYHDHEICGMPPPSSGGMAVAATLGILSHFPMTSYRPTHIDRNGGRPTVDGVHYISEAERIAYADRDMYVADPDFVPLPGGSPGRLLDPEYLARRARSISPDRSMGHATAAVTEVQLSAQPAGPEHGTSHISVVDSRGNAASLTTTIESAFGSRHMVDGFLLNNQLTDFWPNPVGMDGLPVANRVQPGKRPRSSMSPTLVFAHGESGRRGPLQMVTGSPGGALIIQFVVKTLVGVLDWGLDSQQAVSMADFGACNTAVTGVGGEHPDIDTTDNGVHDPLVRGLRERGHIVDLAEQSSGLSTLVRSGSEWVGGADPRREGLVMGDTR